MKLRLTAIAIAVAITLAGAISIAGTPVMAEDGSSDTPISDAPIQNNDKDNGNEDSDSSGDAPVDGFVTINPDDSVAPALIEEVMALLEGLIIGPGS